MPRTGEARIGRRTRTTRAALALVLALIVPSAAELRARASSVDAASRDPQGRGLQLLAEREAIVSRQTVLAAQGARARGLALYRLVLAAKAERRSERAGERPGGRALAIGAAVLSRDLREARLYQGELERVREERRRAVAFAASSPGTETDGAGAPRAAMPHLVPPVSGRLVNGFGVARDEATRSWLFRTAAAFAARGNEPVRAVADGRVVQVGEDVMGGLAVVLSHPQGLRSIVSGLGTVTVSEGTVVRRSAALGTAPPLPSLVRLEIWRGRQAIDPTPMLPTPMLPTTKLPSAVVHQGHDP